MKELPGDDMNELEADSLQGSMRSSCFILISCVCSGGKWLREGLMSQTVREQHDYLSLTAVCAHVCAETSSPADL